MGRAPHMQGTRSILPELITMAGVALAIAAFIAPNTLEARRGKGDPSSIGALKTIDMTRARFREADKE